MDENCIVLYKNGNFFSIHHVYGDITIAHDMGQNLVHELKFGREYDNIEWSYKIFVSIPSESAVIIK